MLKSHEEVTKNVYDLARFKKVEEGKRTLGADEISDLIRERCEGECIQQINEYNNRVEVAYTKLTETHELRKMINSISARILSDSAQYIQQALKDLVDT